MLISRSTSSHCPIAIVSEEDGVGTSELSLEACLGGWDGLAAPFNPRETEAPEG